MKKILLSVILALTIFASNGKVLTHPVISVKTESDSVKMQIIESDALYQNTVKIDTNIPVSLIYARVLEFMARKPFQQKYANKKAGRLRFTTSQDFILPATVGDDYATTEPVTIAFDTRIDIKNGMYRYIINHVLFWTNNGNNKFTLYDMYKRANGNKPWIANHAKKLIASFENYLTDFTIELHEDIQPHSVIHPPQF